MTTVVLVREWGGCTYLCVPASALCLSGEWKPELLEGFTKKGNHLAMDDVHDSIAELAYYRDVFIRP